MLRNAPYICIHIYKYIYYIYIKKKSFENSVFSCLVSGKRPWGCRARSCSGREDRRRVTARDQPAPVGGLATRGETSHSTKRVAQSGAKPPAAPPGSAWGEGGGAQRRFSPSQQLGTLEGISLPLALSLPRLPPTAPFLVQRINGQHNAGALVGERVGLWRGNC